MRIVVSVNLLRSRRKLQERDFVRLPLGHQAWEKTTVRTALTVACDHVRHKQIRLTTCKTFSTQFRHPPFSTPARSLPGAQPSPLPAAGLRA